MYARRVTSSREQEIASSAGSENFASDLPRIAMDLPYLTLDKAKQLEFTEESFKALLHGAAEGNIQKSNTSSGTHSPSKKNGNWGIPYEAK